jgi:hypothetical protein
MAFVSGQRVTITSPSPNETVSSSSLTVLGRSIDNSINNDCKVSVLVNNKAPYRDAIGTGPAGIGDYSSWWITLNSFNSGLRGTEYNNC